MEIKNIRITDVRPDDNERKATPEDFRTEVVFSIEEISKLLMEIMISHYELYRKCFGDDADPKQDVIIAEPLRILRQITQNINYAKLVDSIEFITFSKILAMKYLY